VIHRFVTSGSVERTDPFVEGIFSKGNRFVFFGTPEVAVHRFPNDRSDAHAAALGGIAQLAPGLFGETQIGDDVAGHGGINKTRYRRFGKLRP
jgi:hypothetical protein